ncbi:MAG: HNH endonuclease signature motif containing protein [Bacillota bacterium]|nr:HNH endonuclease signature motif containing protein [Bacillota bacterium]
MQAVAVAVGAHEGGRRREEARTIRVLTSDGLKLDPCSRSTALQEVRLGRARWRGRSTIQLVYNPFVARRIRKQVLKRDHHRCAWCGGHGDTIDHLLPWSQGGLTTPDNCVCSCQECNGRRGDRSVEQFIADEGIRPTHPVVLAFLRARGAGPAEAAAGKAAAEPAGPAAASPPEEAKGRPRRRNRRRGRREAEKSDERPAEPRATWLEPWVGEIFDERFACGA